MYVESHSNHAAVHHCVAMYNILCIIYMYVCTVAVEPRVSSNSCAVAACTFVQLLLVYSVLIPCKEGNTVLTDSVFQLKLNTLHTL